MQEMLHFIPRIKLGFKVQGWSDVCKGLLLQGRFRDIWFQEGASIITLNSYSQLFARDKSFVPQDHITRDKDIALYCINWRPAICIVVSFNLVLSWLANLNVANWRTMVWCRRSPCLCCDQHGRCCIRFSLPVIVILLSIDMMYGRAQLDGYHWLGCRTNTYSLAIAYVIVYSALSFALYTAPIFPLFHSILCMQTDIQNSVSVLVPSLTIPAWIEFWVICIFP